MEEYARRLVAWRSCHRSLLTSSSDPDEPGDKERIFGMVFGLGLLALVRLLVDFRRPGTLTVTDRKLLAIAADLFDG